MEAGVELEEGRSGARLSSGSNSASELAMDMTGRWLNSKIDVVWGGVAQVIEESDVRGALEWEETEQETQQS